jgi:prolyl oligopeptidase
MLRFHKLLAGHSWTGEYGNPDVPAERAALAAYSPFHRLDKTKSYPEVFFLTSTADDRVHPGHARKMAARMEAMGKPILYFEKIEGGHSAAANLEQRIERTALEFAYLFDKLMPETSAPQPAATGRP